MGQKLQGRHRRPRLPHPTGTKPPQGPGPQNRVGSVPGRTSEAMPPHQVPQEAFCSPFLARLKSSRGAFPRQLKRAVPCARVPMEAHLREILGDPLTLAFTLLRVAVVYLVLLLFLRLSGKKVLGQMTPLDLLTLLLLSNVVQNAMIGPDNSLLGGLLGAGLLLLLDRVLSRSRLRRSFMGEPVLLVHEGRPVWDHLRREGVELEELMAALREHGVARLEDVLEAVLEVDGTISVVPKDHLEPKRVRKVRSSRNR